MVETLCCATRVLVCGMPHSFVIKGCGLGTYLMQLLALMLLLLTLMRRDDALRWRPLFDLHLSERCGETY